MVYAPSKKTLRTAREAVKRLKRRWKRLRPHKEQSRCWRSRARFKVLFAGRRSGKTELAKRDAGVEGIGNTRTFHDYPFWIVFAGPTRPQMKNLYWQELQNIFPQEFIINANASDLTVTLWNGTEVTVMSLEVAPRMEGRPIDRLYCDEFSEVKPNVWKTNVRPSLSTEDRFGTGWLYGIPRGGRGSHFHQVVVSARKPSNIEWDCFHWTSASVLPASEIDQARADLDPRTFAQEYEASFQTFAGRAYYCFDYETHAREHLEYNPALPLVFVFDFNRSPGVAGVCQEQGYEGTQKKVAPMITAVFDEVWIPVDSNTRRVCQVLIEKYGKKGLNHKQEIYLHGDATGGIKGHTVPYEGTDWTEIDDMMRREWGPLVSNRVARSNPLERVRVNTLNRRLLRTTGEIYCLIDPEGAPHMADDLDSVLTLEGTAGDLDKESDKNLTHLSDALGYYFCEQHGMGGPAAVEVDI